jgi:hypothetical protein
VVWVFARYLESEMRERRGREEGEQREKKKGLEVKIGVVCVGLVTNGGTSRTSSS